MVGVWFFFRGVASVTLNGLVKALKPGTALIRAMSAADAAKLDNGRIVVHAKRDAGSTTAKAVIPADVLEKAADSLQPDSNGVKKIRIEVSAE
ncbi:hypothetical protein [Paenibacillus alvei]|uniref:hypothetical protein n=1 Tax=Paenibacillus alvei TaxID=44250 RepID=UPI001F509CF8|nr:hypothetical protein [Paenibacillus alvei]MCY9578036.1 hypothetical protein [Paenibacillus alvei]MCY9585330.1 hypothetical protein [Paenibacillus alvei]